MIDITINFVRKWSQIHDKRVGVESEYFDLKDAVAKLPEPKCLNKDLFVRMAMWKSPLPEAHYKANDETDETLVREATSLACEVSNEELKLHILQILKGVRAPVASTILHCFCPDKFPIFDIRVRTSLAKARMWGNPGDASNEAYGQYAATMRSLSSKLGVSLRELDKALWAYDKWGPECGTTPGC